jgi:hypothetical protein
MMNVRQSFLSQAVNANVCAVENRQIEEARRANLADRAGANSWISF